MSLDPNIHYIGFDVGLDAVRRHATRYPQYRFFQADVRNEMYNPEGVLDPETFTLPIEENVADLLICASLFTHLKTLEAAQNSISEVRRVLKTGGHF